MLKQAGSESWNFISINEAIIQSTTEKAAPKNIFCGWERAEVKEKQLCKLYLANCQKYATDKHPCSVISVKKM
jgi:hypothetical protein